MRLRSWRAPRDGEGRATSLLLDRQAFLAEIDLQALRLFAVLIQIVAQHGGDDHERPDDEIEDIVAAHGGSVCLWRWAKLGHRDVRTLSLYRTSRPSSPRIRVPELSLVACLTLGGRAGRTPGRIS